ncbi:nitrile hydratase accessory protein [Agrobacterium rosae]|uniref:Nitrile hydratase accessory protein n=1 Tax=Agrobacterium rosae TaxID=1972867 RepID=A0A1R3U3I4_9HYPH|nr:nitrile hydratase accessory protein [Agrobacterium rosae]SCX36099.1 nitrile hydratase accessory protein [Agrobacterium rosae]
MSVATISQLSGQPLDRDGPVFKAPWEASAFAMTVKLSEAGYFTWPEWVKCLSSVIADHDKHHNHEHLDTNSEYYSQWFEALEVILANKGVMDTVSINARYKYLKDNPAPHDHIARREPVCVA